MTAEQSPQTEHVFRSLPFKLPMIDFYMCINSKPLHNMPINAKVQWIITYKIPNICWLHYLHCEDLQCFPILS